MNVLRSGGAVPLITEEPVATSPIESVVAIMVASANCNSSASTGLINNCLYYSIKKGVTPPPMPV